jgi:two-component system, OmpR family, sensor histidine kinase CpxA
MNVRFPLYAKVLLWFFLNLVAVGAGLYIFFHTQVKLGLNSLMMGRSGDRIQAVSEVITAELNKASGQAAWDDILQRFSDSYHLPFYLFHSDGRQLAGEPVVLPRPVVNVLGERRQPAPGPGGAGRAYPKFMERVADPVRYWVGVRVPVLEDGQARPLPATLLAVSETMSGGGLFLDFKPWILIGLGALLFSVLFWIPLVRGITGSISHMTRATALIADGRFDVQVPARRRDELGSLGQSVNRMASRLAGFVTGQKRFLGDIAHELCSPIARMQMAIGILEQQAGEEQKPCVEDLREEVQQMSELVNELLSFSRASLRGRDLPLQSLPLAELARRVIAREAGGEDQVQLKIADDLTALAEPDLLMRALANLVRNALRYAGSAGPVVISAEPVAGGVVLSVSDSGPGVPAEALQRIFDPFYRLESSRSRETGGIGLGLAIVKTCIEACQGSVVAHSRQPAGLQVDIHLKA